MAKLKAKAKQQRKVKKRTAPKTVAAMPALAIGRMYNSARPTRFNGGWGTTAGSEDTELVSSLTNLRSRSRALVRDAAYARRAKTIITNNVVGPGIGLQALVMSSRDQLRTDVNDDIELAWDYWSEAKSCHTGGTMHFSDLERAIVGQVFEAGEVLVRKHIMRLGRSPIPLALEMIEAERLVDDASIPYVRIQAGNQYRMGVEMDRFFRPIAYHVRNRHPSEVRFQGGEDLIERIPAEEIFHVRIVDRWPQTRSVPWLHAVASQMNNMDSYVDSEITAARAAANISGTIQTPDESGLNAVGTRQDDGTVQVELEPGMMVRLRPGETLAPYIPSRPNTALDPFMRYMIREVAAGANLSYESLSRDYSQSNYSSSRLSLLDDRDTWRALQLWLIRSFRVELHAAWLRLAVLSGSLSTISPVEYIANPVKFEAARFKPRGWSWIDPEKEVAALKEAVRCGFTTMSDVIAQTGDGDDFEDKIKRRRRELDQLEELELDLDTNPVPPQDEAKHEATVKVAESKPPPAPPPAAPPEEEERTAPVIGTISKPARRRSA